MDHLKRIRNESKLAELCLIHSGKPGTQFIGIYPTFKLAVDEYIKFISDGFDLENAKKIFMDEHGIEFTFDLLYNEDDYGEYLFDEIGIYMSIDSVEWCAKYQDEFDGWVNKEEFIKCISQVLST
jgi:hypothetical protein